MYGRPQYFLAYLKDEQHLTAQIGEDDGHGLEGHDSKTFVINSYSVHIKKMASGDDFYLRYYQGHHGK
jgi:hypothetical protein